MPDPLPIFTPHPDKIPEILSDLGDPTRTLLGIAEQHKTTVEALAIWLTLPEIEGRMAALHDAAIHRTRFVALTFLPSAISTLNRIIDDYTDQLIHTPRRPTDNPRVNENRRRLTDGARKSVTLLSHLARLAPPTRRNTVPSAQHAPSPARGRGPLEAQPRAGEGTCCQPERPETSANPSAQAPDPESTPIPPETPRLRRPCDEASGAPEASSTHQALARPTLPPDLTPASLRLCVVAPPPPRPPRPPALAAARRRA
ncbi:MAG: hypothetical protein K2Q20_09180, partial [Phycisphaerales bacterium]|nr:hypothetical protein [Phycisphaerales bacterium]